MGYRLKVQCLFRMTVKLCSLQATAVEILIIVFSCRLMYIRTRKSVADSSLAASKVGVLVVYTYMKEVSFFRRYKLCNYIYHPGGHSVGR